MSTPSGSSTFSGFAIALGFVVYAVVWLAAPGTYFEIERTSDAALICYIVALISLAIGVIGMGFELSNKEVSAFLMRLITGNLPRGIWGRPNSEAWQNFGIAIGLLILTSVIHLIGIEIFDATGTVSGLVKVIVLFSLILSVMFFASAADELLIKPLLLTPARRLAETSNNPQAPSPQSGSTQPRPAERRSSAPVKRLGAGFILVGEAVSILYTMYQIVTSILSAI